MKAENNWRINATGKRRIKYPGLRNLAPKLGVTFPHLWKCLEGHRRGRAGLTEAYWNLVRDRYGRGA